MSNTFDSFVGAFATSIKEHEIWTAQEVLGLLDRVCRQYGANRIGPTEHGLPGMAPPKNQYEAEQRKLIAQAEASCREQNGSAPWEG